MSLLYLYTNENTPSVDLYSCFNLVINTVSKQTINLCFISFTALGCPSPPTPLGGWSRRSENSAILGCNGTTDTWVLRCVNDVWSGSWSNCTIGRATQILRHEFMLSKSGIFSRNTNIFIQMAHELYTEEVIVTKLCTWYDSCEVVAHAKICRDLIINDGIIL